MGALEGELRGLVAREAAKAVKALMDESVHPVVNGAPRDIAVGTTIVSASLTALRVRYRLAAQSKSVTREVVFDLRKRRDDDDDNWVIQSWKALSEMVADLIAQFDVKIKARP